MYFSGFHLIILSAGDFEEAGHSIAHSRFFRSLSRCKGTKESIKDAFIVFGMNYNIMLLAY